MLTEQPDELAMTTTQLAPLHLDDYVRAIVDQLTAGLKDVLRDQLIGIYLYGSLVTEDFDPGISDIDLVVVLSSELDAAQFDRLHQLHQRVIKRQPDWRDRLELAYISEAALRTFRRRTSTIGIISPGEPFHLIQAGSDWLISWYALREDGVALVGPPIRSLIDHIPAAEYLLAVSEHIWRYRDSVKQPHNKSALSYIVLTVARGVYTLEHKAPASKRKAAEWASQRFPRWSALLERAWRWRADPESDGLSPDQIQGEVAAFVADMLSTISAPD